MPTDPFSWARDFGSRQAQAAENEKSRAQQLLLNIFQEEAARQRPYAVMPAALAQAEFNRRNAEPYKVAADRRALDRYAAQRRYYNDSALALAKEKAALGLSPTYPQGMGMIPQGGPVINDDGSAVVMLGGRPVKIPAPVQQDDEGDM